jgi:hypothetical protein
LNAYVMKKGLVQLCKVRMSWDVGVMFL